MSDYLHGIDSTEEEKINLVVQDADISNVCVIGTSPIAEDICKVVNFSESAKYLGNNIEGFTLPDAVETILTESGGAFIYTINIFDYKKHTASVNKLIVFSNNECKLDEVGIYDLTLSQDENELVLDKDYSFDKNTIKILDGSDVEQNLENIVADYKYCDFSKITDSDVIGTVDTDGKRSGLQKIYDIMAIYGITPGIIIAPGFYSKNVRNAIEAIEEKIKAFSYLDCDPDTNVQSAEKARFKEADGIDLTTSNERSMLCAPYVYRYNSYQDTTSLKPLSPVVAGLRVKLDRERNVAKSIDNTVSKTITSTQFPVSFILDDSTTDSNRLNALGVTTVINYKGEYRIWGGRNTSFPNNEGLMTFESVRRTRDFINKSIQETSFVCIGENITRGFIDNILNMINSAFAKWSNPANKNEYIIYGGEAYYDESLNTAESLANGHIYFPYEACPLCSAERITFKDILDITLITKSLNA